MPKYTLQGLTADHINGEIVNLDRVIEKSDFTHEFTVKSIIEHKASIEKTIKELTAQRSLEEAKMNNYTENHPYILDLDDVKRNAISLYHVAKGIQLQCDEKLGELQEVLNDYEQVGLDIKEQTGLNIYGN